MPEIGETRPGVRPMRLQRFSLRGAARFVLFMRSIAAAGCVFFSVVACGTEREAPEISADEQISGACAQATMIAGFRSAQARWVPAGKHGAPGCADYVVRTDTVVPAGSALVIEPGVRVAVEAGVRFAVEGGALIAEGTEAAPIWIGGAVELIDAEEARFDHATIAGGLAARGSTALSLEHSTLKRSAGYGLELDEETELEAFSNNTLTDNQHGAAQLHLRHVRALDAESNYLDNKTNYLRVRGVALDEPTIFPALGTPYLLGEFGAVPVQLNADVTVAPGALLAFVRGSGLSIERGSNFVAAGRVGQPVRFLSLDSKAGAWRGIAVSGGASAHFEHATVQDGGGGDPWLDSQPTAARANLSVLAPARVSIADASISRSLHHPIWVEPSPGAEVSCRDLYVDGEAGDCP